MSATVPETYLQYRTLIKPEGQLELSIAEVNTPEPGPEEILVRIEAAPINPSDLGLMVGPANLAEATTSGTADRPVVTAPISEMGMRAMAPRVGQSLPAGNEGAGVVVKAGSSPAAQALLGKTVAVLGGEMYSQYRLVHLAAIMELPDGTTPRQGASCFVNPLTALGMTETMRMEGHTALVHTAAASNLGQMLNKICIADGIQLVNIVRKPEQEKILRDIGAKHIVNSTDENFMANLIDALAETGATLAFDAIGGGPLAGQILIAMEAAANRNAKEYSRYGSSTNKQVYIYGRLDLSPSLLPAGVGMSWSTGGWLLTPFLQKIGNEGRTKLRNRVAAELNTTFASHYTDEISLTEALDLDTIRAYDAKSTGRKFLLNPNK
ncbi:MAG: zinc-binding dehydrogenase [Hyphomonas sp.]